MSKQSPNPTRRKILEAAAAVGILGGVPGAAGAAPEQTPENTVDYRDLTAKAKRAFSRANSEGANFLGRPQTTPKQLFSYEYVKRRGQLYRLDLHGQFEAHYGGSIERVNGAQTDADVVSFNELSGRARNVFERGRQGGSLCFRPDYPMDLVDNQYVKYRGKTYSTNPVHRDAILNTLSVKKL